MRPVFLVLCNISNSDSNSWDRLSPPQLKELIISTCLRDLPSLHSPPVVPEHLGVWFCLATSGNTECDSQTVGFLVPSALSNLPFLPRTAASAEPDGGGQVLKGPGSDAETVFSEASGLS